MKRLLSIILVFILSASTLAFVGCEKEKEQLATPSNVKIAYDGTISWKAVENATGYIVTIGSTEFTTATNSYKAAVLSDFTFTVKATAEGYESSAPSAEIEYKITNYRENIEVAIEGANTVKTGNSIQLTAVVKNTSEAQPSVYWEIVDGEEYATVSEKGVFTAKSNSGGKTVVVRASSDLNPSKYADKAITITAPPVLTQEMLDHIASFDVVGFTGYVDIDLWTAGAASEFYTQTSTEVETAMNGDRWFASYVNGNTNLEERIFYKNNNGKATQVGISYMNTEEYFPMLDGDREVTWGEAGLYNTLWKKAQDGERVLVSDFRFNEKIWMYEYVGSDPTFIKKMVSSANPYDFTPANLYLMLSSNGKSIDGFYSDAKEDYTIADGYVAYQHLTVAYNLGDDVEEVPSIDVFETQEWHSPLTQAIENMRELNASGSYRLDLINEQYNVYLGSSTLFGYQEIITQDDCYFRDYVVKGNTPEGELNKDFTNQNVYGYKNLTDSNRDFYNAYFAEEKVGGYDYYASRAYASSFNNAKPSFAFAAEIFDDYYEEGVKRNSDGKITEATYYANDLMLAVSSMFYYGVGNDVNMYGLFAQLGQVAGGILYPTLTVELIDGEYYITSAMFYYYLGQLYGVILIEYDQFNTAQVPAEAGEISFTTREVPDSWSQLEIYHSTEAESTTDDTPIKANLLLNDLFGDYDLDFTDNDADAVSELPFFGSVLGDTYGFGMEMKYMPSGHNIMYSAVVLYYDVPLEEDYTINGAIKKVQDLLKANGFIDDGRGNYVKGDISVAPVDNNLDFMIYVWKTPKKNAN